MHNQIRSFCLLLPLIGSLSAAPADKVEDHIATLGAPTPTQATVQTNTSVPATAAVIPDNIDCSYMLSPQITQVDANLVSKWTQKATEQAFTFDFSKIDTQLKDLEACFTHQGWEGFQEAFNKSGNLNAIKSQQLTVSAMSAGTATMKEDKGNQWRLSIPLQVVYQNAQQKLTQDLSVDVLVGRKLSGELGIMQIIATPKAPAATTTTPAAATPPANTSDKTAEPMKATAPTETTAPATPPAEATPTTAMPEAVPAAPAPATDATPQAGMSAPANK